MAKKRKQFGFVIDPLEGFNPRAETTLFLMAEAQRRGHRLFCFTLPRLFFEAGSVWGQALEIRILGIGRRPFYRVLQEKRMNLAALDVLFLRKDPPADRAYLDHLYLLSLLKGQVWMMNDPQGILNASEKISPLKFPEFVPPTLITRRWEEVLRFSDAQSGGLIVKPLHSSGGRGVFYLNPQDTNLKVAFELLSREGARPVICQKYLAEVQKGDKRIMLLDGKILGYFLRVPQKGQHRANLHSGGILKKCSLTSKEREIAVRVGEAVCREGLYFVGLDLIGEHLTEINVTSPMGLHEMNQTLGGRSEIRVIDFVEGMIP